MDWSAYNATAAIMRLTAWWRMTIRKRGSKFVLVSKRSGRTLGTHASRAGAEAQESAINISKAREAGHKIPKKRRSSDEPGVGRGATLLGCYTTAAHSIQPWAAWVGWGKLQKLVTNDCT